MGNVLGPIRGKAYWTPQGGAKTAIPHFKTFRKSVTDADGTASDSSTDGFEDTVEGPTKIEVELQLNAEAAGISLPWDMEEGIVLQTASTKIGTLDLELDSEASLDLDSSMYMKVTSVETQLDRTSGQAVGVSVRMQRFGAALPS